MIFKNKPQIEGIISYNFHEFLILILRPLFMLIHEKNDAAKQRY